MEKTKITARNDHNEKVTLRKDRDSRNSLDIPEEAITLLMPVMETVCHPRISRYSVTTMIRAGYQDVFHTVQKDESIPSFDAEFRFFNGSFQQWIEFADALHVYDEFASNLNKSSQYNRWFDLDYDKATKYGEPYVLKNGTAINTCQIEKYEQGRKSSESDIWPLSVFERRLNRSIDEIRWDRSTTLFSPEIANELLINSTINMLSLNKHYGMVDGTVSRAYNVYRFRNRRAFFLPYGLSLGLSLPIIALGLTAFYMRNQSISAISGGFFQILMTTTGRGSLEDVIVKGSGTLGGIENVSEELKNTKIRFGELVETKGTDDNRPKMLGYNASIHEGLTESLDTYQREDNHKNVTVGVASSGEISEQRQTITKRAGFGIAREVKPFRKGTT
ncbi:hypothetical protein G6514_002538 [Epicoccum nigrum]|nr:hypothetical protein G6514_002538 [Epicoccum nigrum]